MVETIQKEGLLRVGELAKLVGKSVRALHLYEELGLLVPISRTSGGFRLYHPDAANRIQWIIKFQAIGFSLTEIRGFVTEFEQAQSGQAATDQVREVFAERLAGIRDQITQLQVVENDLVEALEYLEDCQSCAPTLATDECGVCNHQGHEPGVAPELFAGLSRVAISPAQKARYDVGVDSLAGRIRTPHTKDSN